MLTAISNIFKSQVQLYELTKGTEKLYITSGDKDFTFQNRIYKPMTIKASSIKSTQDKAKANTTLTTDKDCPLGEWFLTATPGNVRIFIYRTSRANPENYERIFNGTIMSAEFKASEIEFTCEPLIALTSRPICRYTYQTQCNHHVYKNRCKLNIEDHSYFTTITNIESDGITITIANRDINEYPVGELVDGFIQTTNNVAGQILEDNNTIIKILAPIENLKVGDTIRVAKGCDRSSATCKARFNNFDNFFGFEAVPTRNIFEDGINDTANDDTSSDE